MLAAMFHAWERRLAYATTNRVVRPFEWGADWIPVNGHPFTGSEPERVRAWIERAVADTDAFFSAPPTDAYRVEPAADGQLVTFPSAIETPHPANNTVYARYFPATPKRRPTDAARHLSVATGRAAVVVLPQWN